MKLENRKFQDEASVAIVRFYGLLTEPSPEFIIVGDDKDWFKIGKSEMVKVGDDLEDISFDILLLGTELHGHIRSFALEEKCGSSLSTRNSRNISIQDYGRNYDS